MSYSILLHPKANGFLESADGELKDRIKKKLRSLSSDPDKGKKLNYSDFWSLRIGDYRAIYEVDRDAQRAIILFIGHRKEVYDDFSRLLD